MQVGQFEVCGELLGSTGLTATSRAKEERIGGLAVIEELAGNRDEEIELGGDDEIFIDSGCRKHLKERSCWVRKRAEVYIGLSPSIM